jgi:hypothetical protein
VTREPKEKHFEFSLKISSSKTLLLKPIASFSNKKMETTLSLLRTTNQRLLNETDYETDDDDYVYTGGKYEFLITPGVIVCFFATRSCFWRMLHTEGAAPVVRAPPAVARESNQPIQFNSMIRASNQPRNITANSNDNVGTSATELSNYNFRTSSPATSNYIVGASSRFDDDRFTQRRNRIDKMLLYKVRLDNVPPTKSRCCNAFRVLTNILYSSSI